MNSPISKIRVIGCVVLSVCAASTAVDAKVWKSSTFLDRVDGTLGDGGANTYVAADGSVRLINLNDLNQDGRLDLVAPTDHSQSDGRVDLSIFWGKTKLAAQSVTRLPTDRGKACAAADLNGDGHVDLVVANFGSDPWRPIRTGQSSFIYWGSATGFSAANRTELETEAASGVDIADIDSDGSLDLVFANIGNFISADHHRKSFVYWGEKGRFDAARRVELDSEKASDVVVADVNGDRFADVLIAQEGNLPGGGGVLIYWGGASRPEFGAKSTRLAGDSCAALAVGDLNGDGRPELVVANQYRSKGRESNGVYTIDNEVQLDSLIYWGGADGYSVERRTALPTLKATGVAIGDLNGDQLPEIVFANCSGGVGYGSYTAGTKQGSGEAYVYWNSPDGFAAHRRLALTGNYIHDCAVADVDGDGHRDVILANQSDGKSYDITSFVYWGSPAGPSIERRTELPTYGASGALVADLDRDGKSEVIFANSLSNTAPGNRNHQRIYWGDGSGRFSEKRAQLISLGAGYVGAGSYSIVDLNTDGFADLAFSGITPLVYWGGRKGFTEEDKSVISTRYSFYGTFADFNRDGWLDFVCSEFHPGSHETRLYFGSPTGFAAQSRFAFRLNGPRASCVADLNRDGWLDVVFTTSTDSCLMSIFWGSPNGFDNGRRTELPVGICPAGRIADLNRDGWLDIAVANLLDPKKVPGPGEPRHTFGGSPRGDALIYWGGADGYRPANRLVLPAIGIEDIGIADFNRDGFLDIAASHYSGSVDRKHPSYVYWNGPSGFAAEKVTLLPTFAASGVMAADFDDDGFPDIRFANHVKDSNHEVSNFIYFANKDGFSVDRRTEVYNPGPHLLSGVDVGNVYDRSDRYEYVSPPYDAGAVTRFESISWEGETPFRTRLEFQVRTAASREGLKSAGWVGPVGAGSFFKKPGERMEQGGRWIQYRATLVSPNDINSPVLRAVIVSYR